MEAHLDEVAARAGSVDVSLNAIDVNEVQGIPLAEMSMPEFLTPITEAARTHFVTATAAARRMTAPAIECLETSPGVAITDIQYLIDATALGRLPRLAEVADTAAFVASDYAGAITGAVVNLTCGAIVD